MPRRRALLTLGLCLSIVLGWALFQWWTDPSRMYDVPDRLDNTVEHAFWLGSIRKYDRIALCVHVVNGTIDDARFARDQLRTASTAFLDPAEVSPPYPVIRSLSKQLPPLIDLGCPSEPVLFSGSVVSDWLWGLAARADAAVSNALDCCHFGLLINRGPHAREPGRRVAQEPDDPLPAPSPYWVHVYLVALERYSSLIRFGNSWSVGYLTEEYSTDGPASHVISSVTDGAYVTADQVADISAMEALLQVRFNLKRRVPLPPDPNALPTEPVRPADPLPTHSAATPPAGR